MAEQVLTGQVASEGIAVGPLVHWSNKVVLDRTSGSVAEERAALDVCLTAARTKVETMMSGLDEMAAEIMEFQLAMLEDEDFLKPAEDLIDQGLSADAAWREVCDAEIKEYASSDNEYLAARVDDLRDIRDRVLRSFLGEDRANRFDLPSGAIVIADNLKPSDFLAFDWRKLGGAALQGGSPTSHVSILARARAVPLLVGVSGVSGESSNGVSGVLDAISGRLILAPSEETISGIMLEKSQLDILNAKADFVRGGQAFTADGAEIKVLVNVDNPDDLDNMKVEDCDGIGLFRTEFLIEGATIPSEDQQFEIYRKVSGWANGRPVTIRTFDAGGDKPVPGMSRPNETNPFMGVRGVRLSLTMPEIFKTQLRALVRANVDGNLKIMVPMVTVPAEMKQVNALLTEVCEGLENCNRPQLGMMVEVPAAALTAHMFKADFFSIGSNDLVQYTMATARDNAAITYLAQADNPAVLALISQTINAAAKMGIEVSLCGDMASSDKHTKSLLDAGLRTFSVSNALLGRVKLAISTATISGEQNG